MQFSLLTPELLRFRVGRDPEIDPEWFTAHLSDIISYDPKGCFAICDNDAPVGMITSTSYQDRAWLGWLFVLDEYRGRGLGARLMNHVIDYARERGAKTILLEADTRALSLYLRLGFTEQFRTQHFTLSRGMFTAGHRRLADVTPVKEDELAALADFDRRYFGQSRHEMFKLVSQNAIFRGLVARIEGEIAGFLFTTEASENQQVGPFIVRAKESAGEQIAGALIREAFKACAKPLYFRCPMVDENRSDLLTSLGAARVDYHTVRMYLGDEYELEKQGVLSLGCPGKG